MNTNRSILDFLFQTNRIDLRRGALFDTSPGPMPDNFYFDRVEGMMLGLAVGDALGVTTEGRLPEARAARYGEIRDYLPSRRHHGRALGYPSDDTQLAFWTLEQMLADGGFIPENLAARFCRNRIFGIGSTVKAFIANYRSGKKQWYECGPKAAGNGALMRIAPMLIPHLKTGTAELWVDTALSAMITHNDSASIAACLAFVNMLQQLLRMASPPEPSWWFETFVKVAGDLESDRRYRPRVPQLKDFRGTLSTFVAQEVPKAYQRNLSVLEACSSWFSGAYLLETVPSVIFICMNHADSFEKGLVRAVNDTKDNDTVAAIVGAALGALHGKRRIPQRWLQKLTGRTATEDNGRVFEVLEKARTIWWGGA